MCDPREGITSAGTISTGASRERVLALFEPVLDAAVSAVHASDPAAGLYASGSVATGMAHPVESVVDLLTVGLSSTEAAGVSLALSAQCSGRCREVEVAAAQPGDFRGESDAAYGGRVFLRHYCVHRAGPDLRSGLSDFAADVRAARGFSGDVARHAVRWRRALVGGLDPIRLISWSRGVASPDGRSVAAALAGIVERIVASFESTIGLWDSATGR